MRIKAAAVIAIILVFMLLLGGCGTGGNMKQITDFTYLLLEISKTSTIKRAYELVNENGKVTLSCYVGAWRFEDDLEMTDCLESAVSGDEELYEKLLALLNDCRVGKWNGFDKVNRHLLDGGGFTLTGTLNGAPFSARGSNAYPRRYADFLEGLQTLLRERER